MMQHVVRGSIIQSRAAHYHIGPVHQDASATMLRQFAAAALSPEQGLDFTQPCMSLPVSKLQLPLQLPVTLPETQLPSAVAPPVPSSPGLLLHVTPGPHVAWAEQPRQAAADQVNMTTNTTPWPAALAATTFSQVSGLSQQPVMSKEPHHNMLYEVGKADQPIPGHSYQTALAHYRQQMESSLESLRGELEAFQTEMLRQLGTMSNADEDQTNLLA